METHAFVLSGVCLWLALHSFTSYPLSLWVLQRLGLGRTFRAAGAAPRRTHTFAICTCAYNEQAVIDAKLRNLLALRVQHPDLDILVYVDASTDATAEICRRYEDQIQLHVAQQRHGKTHGMNLLVQQTHADIVVFTDANVLLAPDAIDRLEDHFQDAQIGCVCGNLTYVNSKESVTASSGSLYWRIEEGIKRLESRTGSVIGADGSLFALRSRLHVAPPDHIIDDFFVSLMVMCQGDRVVQALDVKAFEESVAVPGEEYRRKVRIACQAFNVHRLLWQPHLARLGPLTLYKYISHKLPRWFAIYFLALAWAFCVLGALGSGWLFGAACVAASPIALWALGAHWPTRPFSHAYDILAAFVATGVGVIRSIRGRQVPDLGTSSFTARRRDKDR